MPLYIEQYSNIVEDRNGNEAQVPGGPIGAEPTQQVAIGASSARTSTDLDGSTEFLILSADADCQFELGDSTVTADSNSRILFAGTYREVARNGATRVAVIEKQ